VSVSAGAASDLALDGQLVGGQEKPIDWNKVLREMRAAGVRSSGDELEEHDLRALWGCAEGPYAPVAPPAERLTGERPDESRELAPAEEEGGQLAFDLAA
jgi:hypothetical protein